VVYADFIELVAQRDVRPERPDIEDAPYLSDAIWKLMQTCWIKDPTKRPTASAACHMLSQLHDGTSIAKPKPKPPHMISQPSSPLPLTFQKNLTMRGHTDKVYCATFSADGKYVVSGSVDHTIRLWDAQSGNLVLGPLEMHTDAVICVAFSPSGRRIASGSNDHTVWVWDAMTGHAVAGPLEGHTGPIMSVCFSPNGERLVSSSSDRTIRVWDPETGDSLLGPLTGHSDVVRDVKFSGDGTRMVSCSDDKTIRVWDTRSGRLIHGPLRGHEDPVYFVAFSLDGKKFISVSKYRICYVWDTDTGALLRGSTGWGTTVAVPVVFTPNNNTVTVSPDGKWTVSSVKNSCAVKIVDLRTGKDVATFDAHADQVRSVAFSPDGKQILTASDDKTIRIHVFNL
jgi:WD40 repeat protein